MVIDILKQGVSPYGIGSSRGLAIFYFYFATSRSMVLSSKAPRDLDLNSLLDVSRFEIEIFNSGLLKGQVSTSSK